MNNDVILYPHASQSLGVDYRFNGDHSSRREFFPVQAADHGEFVKLKPYTVAR